MANIEEKKSVPERIDKNSNREFSQQEIKDFIFDKKNGQQNIKDLVNFLEKSKQNRLDPYGKDKYFIDNFQNIMNLPEMSEMFTKIDEKINKNENLTNDEKSLIYLDAITVGKRRKNTYDMSSGGIIHREIFLKDSKTPFNPNDPIRKICDGEFLNYIRCCYGNQNYNPEQYSPIPDKGSTIQDNKNYIKDPIKFKQEKGKEEIESNYEGLPRLKENVDINDFNKLLKWAEDNYGPEIIKVGNNAEAKHRFKDHKYLSGYINYEKIAFAYTKYVEIINAKHSQIIEKSGYANEEDLKKETKDIEELDEFLKTNYGKGYLKYIEKIGEAQNKYFENENEIEEAQNKYIKFGNEAGKIKEEYGNLFKKLEVDEESLSDEDKILTLVELFEYSEKIKNTKNQCGGEEIINKYISYEQEIALIQRPDESIINKVQKLSSKINFDKYNKYCELFEKNGIKEKFNSITSMQSILNNVNDTNFPSLGLKEEQRQKQLEQDYVDAYWESWKHKDIISYRVAQSITTLENLLVEGVAGSFMNLIPMFGRYDKDEAVAFNDWKNKMLGGIPGFAGLERRLSTSQNAPIYEGKSTGIGDFFSSFSGDKFNITVDNMTTQVVQGVGQMLLLIYGGGAIAKGLEGLGVASGVASKAGLFLSSMYQQAGQSYIEGINSGLSENGAFAYSFFSSCAQSGLELISPNEILLGKGSSLGKTLIQSICKNESGKKIIGKFFIKTVITEISEENIQEGLQLAAGNLINDFVNGVWGTDLPSDWSINNFIQTAIITTLTTGITTGFSAGKKGLQIMRSSQPQLMARISSDQDLYNDVINIINNSINGKFQIPNVDPKQLTALKYTLELMNTEGNNDQQENSQNNAENNNQEPENQENTDTKTQTKKKREKKKDKDYFDGQSHEFDVTQDQAIKNSQYMDNILESINEGNMVNELDNLRKRISEQYHEATGENIELTDEQLLSILDAHEQDGILGELTIGQLKQKVKILSETVTDPKFRRFLFEAGFCGKYLELTELQQEKIDYLRKHEVRINEENIDYLSTLTESEMREISSFQIECGISFIKTDAAKLLQLSEEEKEWVIEASKFGFVDYKYDDVMEISKIDEKGKNILRELNTIGLEGSFSSYSVKDLSKLTSNDVNKLKKMKSMGYPIRYFFYDIIENLSNDQINMLYQLYKMRVEIPGVGWSEIVGKMTPEIVTKIKNEGSAEITLEGGEKVNLVRDSYFNGKAHQFNVTESQAIDNSQKMDYILNNVNEENLSRYLQSMREDINEQYFVTTGEDIELTDEQLLSILDAHEQDGILGELTTGQLKQKVKILDETIADPKIRRFLLEAGFCGSKKNIVATNETEKQINTTKESQDNENIKQNNQEVLSSMGINVKHGWDTGLDSIIIDFRKVQELKDLGVIGDEISRYETGFLYNLKNIDIQKVKELIEFGIVVYAGNVESLSKLNIDYKKLNKLKNMGDFQINACNIEYYNNLEITDDEIMRCKKHGLNKLEDTEIVNFFVTNLHNANRSIIENFIESKHNYLKKNRTISEQTYKELFGGIGKYGKTEINQRGLALCYMYNGFELLKKTNWFDTVIQTNLRETQDGWEVRQPFCDKEGKWIKVNKNEIDKIVNINDNGKIRQANINSESEYYGFKILEIAFMKQKLINDYLNNIERYQDLQPILSAYVQYKSTGDFLLTGDLVSLISDGRSTSEMINNILAQNYQLLNRTLKNYSEYDCAIELFEMGLINMDLDVIIKNEYANHQILIAEDGNGINGVVALDVKIINESGENIIPKFTLDNEGNLKRKGPGWPDIVTTSKGNNVVMFFEDHEYSIEKFYIDKNTGEKRVLIINPRHTGVKFDINFEEAKSIFCWNAFGFNISAMFPEE